MRIILSILLLSVCYSQDCEEGVVADDCGVCGGNIFIIESEYFQYVCEDTTTCQEVYDCWYEYTTIYLGSDSYCSAQSCPGYAYQSCSSHSQCIHSGPNSGGLIVGCDDGAYCITTEQESEYVCDYVDDCTTETQCGYESTGICNCEGDILDCEGICDGGKVQDACGLCGGNCTDACDACGNCGGDCVDGGGGNCIDTDNGATDTWGDDCASWYDSYPSYCCSGLDCTYNDDNFDSAAMCCACGGGVYENGTIVCYDDPDNFIKADECGVCGGDGISDNCGTCDNDLTNDCAQDECGVWGGDGILLWNECYSIASTESLNLYDNQLTGQISESIGNLTNLEYLSLSDNQLTGQIPESIGNLTSLEYLSLSSNQLTGPIPNEIENLTKLESLVLSNNMLEGELPEIIGELNNLYLLFVWGNQLSGKIPESIGNLTQLERLSLSSNYFYGEIPESICDLSVEWGDTTESGGSNFQIFNNKLCIPYPDCIESYMGNQECYGCMDHNACNFNSNAVGNAGNCTYSNQGFDCDGEPLSLFNNGLIPEDFSIHSIYPNPFNPVTNIIYGLPEHVNVQIVVYDLSGKQVETLISEFQAPGYHSVNWDADNLPSGVYLIRMESGEFIQTQKVVLVK